MATQKITYHKHAGMATSDGKLKSHPITVQHKDPKVQAIHNASLKNPPKAVPQEPPRKIVKEVFKKPEPRIGAIPQDSLEPQEVARDMERMQDKHKSPSLPPTTSSRMPGVVESEGFLLVDVTALPSHLKGIRIKFQRMEQKGRSRVKRTCGLEITK